MSFHGHSCPSIIIICIQPQAVAGAEAGKAHVFFFFEQLGWCPPWELVRTLRIGSGAGPPHNNYVSFYA